MADLTKKFDVLVIGGGNAALCAAISATRAGASVLVLEGAPKFYRGGNTRHTRNMRCAHDAATEILTGPYTEEEFWDDLLRLTGGQTDEELAKFMIKESKDILNWIVEQGVRWQPSLGGTLSLGRTNSFFLGGGRAMLNALYLTAEKLGVEIRYDAEVIDLQIEDGMFLSAKLKQPIDGASEIRASALVAAAGGFEANIEWLKEYWGDAADNFLIRGTPYNRGSILKMLLDKGVQDIGDPTQCHAVAIDARAPKFDGGIITRHDSVVFGIVVNKHAQRFYDEGEDIWPKRYAIWGRLVAAQPDQIAYIIFDSSVVTSFMPTLFPPIGAPTIAELAVKLELDPAALEKTAHRFQRRGAARHLRPHHSGRLPHRRHHAGQDALGAEDRARALSRLSGAARHHLHLSRHPREQAVAHGDEGRQALRQHVRGRRDHGRQRARQGLRRRHRHDHRQRVRPGGGTGSGTQCEELEKSPRPALRGVRRAKLAERSDCEAIRVRGSLREHGAWREPLTPTLSPQRAGRGR